MLKSTFHLLQKGSRQSFASSFHTSIPVRGFEEFIEVKKPNETVVTGRGWTVPDLRRKSFDDLHKLWFVLYKERNLLLTEKERIRRIQRPVSQTEENRYNKVKRSMAAIKVVLNERKRIERMWRAEAKENDSATQLNDQEQK